MVDRTQISIKKKYQTKMAAEPRLGTVVQAAVTDLGRNPVALIRTADASGGSYSAAIGNLLNEIKAKLNNMMATPDFASCLGNVNEPHNLGGPKDFNIKTHLVSGATNLAFVAGDAANLAAATGAEVVAALNGRLNIAQYGLVAQVTPSTTGRVQIRTIEEGSDRFFQLTAGTADALTVLGLAPNVPPVFYEGAGFVSSLKNAID